MLTIADVQLVRDVIDWRGELISDTALMSSAALAGTWSELTARYPLATTETDESRVAIVKAAQAYLVARRALDSAPVVSSSRVGDMSMTLDRSGDADLGRVWYRHAWELLDGLYPGQPKKRLSAWFTTTHGTRGE